MDLSQYPVVAHGMTVPELAAQGLGGVAAAQAKGYAWDAVNESWRKVGQSFAVSAPQVIPQGTTFTDIRPDGTFVYSSPALNLMEQEANRPENVAQRAAKVALHDEITRAQAAQGRLNDARDLVAENRELALAYAATSGYRALPTGQTTMNNAVTSSNAMLAAQINENWFTDGIKAGWNWLTGGEECPQGQIRLAGKCYGVGDLIPGGNQGGGTQLTCGPGQIPAADGTCVAVATTGGTTSPAAGLVPTMGLYGAGVLPVQVGTVNGAPIRRCPGNFVLGKDDVCYNPRELRREERKWKPARKPLLSAQDAKILNKAHSLENKLNRVAGRFLAPPRPTRKKKGRGRARK